MGRAMYMGKVDGVHQYVSMVHPSIMNLSNRKKPDGSINVDSDAHGVLWEELYHHDDGMARGKSTYGTHSPKDIMKHANGYTGPHHLSHERRATRFQNIIRNRLGGKRVDRRYGTKERGTPVPDHLGSNLGQ